MSELNDREALPATRVTVIVPCYNHERYLTTMIDSLKRQTFTDLAVVAVDDASTDNSAAVMRKALSTCDFPNRFIEHDQNTGLCRSLNDALRLVESEYVATISSDDWIYPHALERLVARFDEAGETCAVCYGDADEVDAHGKPLGTTFLEKRIGDDPRPDRRVAPDLMRINFVPPLATLVRVDAVRQVGVYDERLLTEDFDMLIRLATRFSFAHVPEALGAYRVLEHSLTSLAFGDNRQRSREDKMVSIPKALNVDPETDAAAVERLRHLTTLYYLDGGAPEIVARQFRLITRYRWRPMTFAYLVAAKMGLPGTWLHRAKRLAKLGRFQ